MAWACCVFNNLVLVTALRPRCEAHVAVRDTMRPLLVGLGTAAAAAAAIAIYQRRRRSPPFARRRIHRDHHWRRFDRRGGVIYKHTVPFLGVPEALAKLRAAGKRLFFVTNAASASRESLAKKLAKMGISGVTAVGLYHLRVRRCSIPRDQPSGRQTRVRGWRRRPHRGAQTMWHRICW